MKKLLLFSIILFSSTICAMEHTVKIGNGKKDILFTHDLDTFKAYATQENIFEKIILPEVGYEMSPLQWATEMKLWDIVSYCIERFDLTEYNKNYSNISLVHKVANDNNIELIQQLIDKSYDVNVLNENKQNALWACMLRFLITQDEDTNLQCIVILIKNGSDITNINGNTMFIDSCASMYNLSKNSYNLIFYQGLEHIIQNSLSERALKLNQAQSKPIEAFNITDETCNNLLHVLVLHENKFHRFAMAAYLIHYGTDMNAKNSDGNTPLHLAAANGYWRLVGHLLSKGADMFI